MVVQGVLGNINRVCSSIAIHVGTQHQCRRLSQRLDRRNSFVECPDKIRFALDDRKAIQPSSVAHQPGRIVVPGSDRSKIVAVQIKKHLNPCAASQLETEVQSSIVVKVAAQHRRGRRAEPLEEQRVLVEVLGQVRKVSKRNGIREFTEHRRCFSGLPLDQAPGQAGFDHGVNRVNAGPLDARGFRSVAPLHDQHLRLASNTRRKHNFAAVAAQVAATGNNLPRRCSTLPHQPNFAAHAALQANLNARLLRSVTIERGRLVEVVGHEIEIAIVVEVRHPKTIRNPIVSKPEFLANIRKAQPALVTEQHIRRVVARLKLLHLVQGAGVLAPRLLRRLDPQARVHVHRVERKSVGHQHVVVAVEIGIEKTDVPRPGRRSHAGVIRGVEPLLPTLGNHQYIAVEARHVGPVEQPARACDLFFELHQTACAIGIEHVQQHKVRHAISVKICEVHAHRRTARVSDIAMRHQLERAIALIDPKPVRAGKIIANVQVRKQVIVHVAKRDSQAPFAK